MDNIDIIFWLKNVKCLIITFFQINLRLILVSGKTKEFLFCPNDSAGDIAQFVFDNWPEGKIVLLTSLY